MKKSAPLIAITLGDPAGIGPEVVAKALRHPRLPKGFCYEIIGVSTGPGVRPGQATLASARSALRALDQAARGCREGRYAAMVTGPVQKETIARLRPGFVGQTEFLAETCGQPDDAVMILTDPRLTVALCTHHCSLAQALRRLKPKRIVRTARELDAFLKKIGIAQPRLALAAINPHAGENGLFGDEEERLQAPALKQLQGEGIAISGPHSADTLFYQATQGAYDGVVCAYHDQGLIPFKLVAFTTGVNFTAGLPLIRTSPDHGTALALAGRGVADAHSMLAAIRLACRLVGRRDRAGSLSRIPV